MINTKFLYSAHNSSNTDPDDSVNTTRLYICNNNFNTIILFLLEIIKGIKTGVAQSIHRFATGWT